ncbi:Uncharacterised protein [Mycobacteroides abscessus subsp. abscessus]|nr:Uncharacterised protein [Mycobacteroides abscessus subsp. abscessus]
MRQPNGICTPASSPASISEVAASAARCLPLRANVTSPPCPCGAARETANRSRCSSSARPASAHVRCASSSMPSGPHAHVWRRAQSGTSAASDEKSRRP